MLAPLPRESPKEDHQAQVQAQATNSGPKPTKVLSMLDYAPSTGPANRAESGRKLDFGSNHSLAEPGKYRHGRPLQQRLSVRKLRVDTGPPTVKVKRTAAATSAAIRVPQSTPPTSPAHPLLQSPYLPNCLEYFGRRDLSEFGVSMYSTTLSVL